MDSFTVEITETGLVKVTTDEITPANHMSADAFIKFLNKELGEPVREKRRQSHSYTQAHAHARV